TSSFCSASSITRVSSASSRPRTCVLPLDSAASSSTRLEMLLEPGSRTVPATGPTGASSSDFNSPTSLIFAVQPAFARPARAREDLFQRGRIVLFQHVADGMQFLLVQAQFIQQPVPVRDADVAPHLRVAGRDA